MGNFLTVAHTKQESQPFTYSSSKTFHFPYSYSFTFLFSFSFTYYYFVPLISIVSDRLFLLSGQQPFPSIFHVFTPSLFYIVTSISNITNISCDLSNLNCWSVICLRFDCFNWSCASVYAFKPCILFPLSLLAFYISFVVKALMI